MIEDIMFKFRDPQSNISVVTDEKGEEEVEGNGRGLSHNGGVTSRYRREISYCVVCKSKVHLV